MNVDVIAALGAVVELNTEHYKSDFQYDIELFKRAASEPDGENSRLLWLSRQSGTECFAERDVYFKDCHAHNSWCYYADSGGGVKAFAVEITGAENGSVKGNLCELDYPAHVRDVKKAALPVEMVALKFKDGAELTLPFQRFNAEFQALSREHGQLIDRRNEPQDSAALVAILADAHRERQDERVYRPAEFKLKTKAKTRKNSIHERIQEKKSAIAAEKTTPQKAVKRENLEV
jgi:hypothetical protein